MLKKLISELPMLSLGTGVALAGASLTVIGAYGIKKNFGVSSITMGAGAWLAYVGSQVAIGGVERVRGLQ